MTVFVCSRHWGTRQIIESALLSAERNLIHMLITKLVDGLQRQADRNEAVLEQMAKMLESITALTEMCQTIIVSTAELFESMSQLEYKMRQAYIACNGKDDVYD